jgi:hypothetical protein
MRGFHPIWSGKQRGGLAAGRRAASILPLRTCARVAILEPPFAAVRVKCRAMTIQAAVADTSTKTVTFGGKTYNIQALSDDSYTVLLAGIPVGRVVYSFGAANGVPEGNAMSEDDLYAIAEAWFAAVDA